MSRYIALPLLLLLLAACQSPKGANAGAQDDISSEAGNFNRDTVQTYDIQSGQYVQQPPFGTRGDRAQ